MDGLAIETEWGALLARRTAFDPRDKQLDITFGQQIRILKIAIAYHCLIRRHAFFKHFFFDRFRPGACFFIRSQRNIRFDLARRVTAQTIALQDTDDFFVEGNRGCDGIVRIGR